MSDIDQLNTRLGAAAKAAKSPLPVSFVTAVIAGVLWRLSDGPGLEQWAAMAIAAAFVVLFSVDAHKNSSRSIRFWNGLREIGGLKTHPDAPPFSYWAVQVIILSFWLGLIFAGPWWLAATLFAAGVATFLIANIRSYWQARMSLVELVAAGRKDRVFAQLTELEHRLGGTTRPETVA